MGGILNELVEKIGVDKILHFSLGGLICSIMAFIFMLQEGNITPLLTFKSSLFGTIIVFIISVIKEIADGKFDWKDILAALLGCVAIMISIGLGTLFWALSY